ncbi:hypothetical protein DRQ33_04595 [bacterium]|nr:MAG: hypothetical protein DRQ33_04595 [bacterium]
MNINKNKIERTRRIIIEAANQLFKKTGLSEINMNQIAKIAKVARSTVYNYFHSREEVFSDVIRGELKKIRNALMETLSEKSADRMLEKYFLVRHEILREFSQLYHNSKDEIKAILPEIKEESEKLREFEKNLIKEILEYGAKSDEFFVKDIDLLAETINKFLIGLEKLVIDEEISDEDAKKYYKNFYLILLSAVKSNNS